MEIEGYTYKLGKNKKENWKILSEAKSTDLFFHLSSFPSGYLIIECNDEISPPINVLKIAAFICKEGTKYRSLKNVKVDFTTCGNVRKTENVGEIEYINKRKVNQIKI